jgi:SAM-dependent methyltransferase
MLIINKILFNEGKIMDREKLHKYDKLNLGCGAFKKEGFINIDSSIFTDPDLIYDLNNVPYPFDNESFNLIEADHVLEHLNDPFLIMKELHRILKNEGRIIIRVPHFSRGFSHPGHKRGFDVTFPFYFRKDLKLGYCGVSLKLKSLKFKWFAQLYLKKTSIPAYKYIAGLTLGYIFNALANFAPNLCSRFWCFWVGGFEEIEFIFTK